MNEIQFCIMMITALGVGFITPPLGLNLFVVSGITGESILRIALEFTQGVDDLRFCQTSTNRT